MLFILNNNLGQVLTSSYGYTLIVKLSLAVVMLAFGSVQPVINTKRGTEIHFYLHFHIN